MIHFNEIMKEIRTVMRSFGIRDIATLCKSVAIFSLTVLIVFAVPDQVLADHTTTGGQDPDFGDCPNQGGVTSSAGSGGCNNCGGSTDDPTTTNCTQTTVLDTVAENRADASAVAACSSGVPAVSITWESAYTTCRDVTVAIRLVGASNWNSRNLEANLSGGDACNGRGC